jgi:hypothetical protein
MPHDYNEIDAKILRAISEYEGVPNPRGLEFATGVSALTITKRVNASPAIQERMEKRGRQWLETSSDESFVAKCKACELGGQLPAYAKAIKERRIAILILKAIKNFEGIPYPTSLARAIGLDKHSIVFHINNSPEIQERMEERGRKWLLGISEKEFLELHYSGGGVTKMPAYAKKLVEQRIKEILLGRIGTFEGIPTLVSMEDSEGIKRAKISKYLKAYPELKERMEARGRKWLLGIEEKEFLKRYSKGEFKGSLPAYAKELAAERLDSIILRGADAFEGVPTACRVADCIGIGKTAVLNRAKYNPEIAARMEKRGRRWLRGLGKTELVRLKSSSRWLANLPTYAKEIITGRFREIVLMEIGRSVGAPSSTSLGEAVGVHGTTLMRHIKESEELWLAYQKKRGVSRDQAIELALERGESAKGIMAAVKNRLRHISASREIIGLMRCFGELMGKAVSCVSLYPDVVSVAAKEAGVHIDATHIPMNAFRKGEAQQIPGCGTVLVQGLHRLGEEGVNALFGEIGKLYAAHPELSIITTHSRKYCITEGFIGAMGKNGFRLEESGSLKIESPDAETLESYGVAAEDFGRIKSKLGGEFGVSVFSVHNGGGAMRIPALEKRVSAEGESIVLPVPRGMDVPKGMGKELRARFFQSMKVTAGDPFVVELLHGGEVRALIGFDMHPRRARAVEVEVFPGAPAAEYRKIARLLATNLGFRRDLGVKPNRLTVAKLKACRQAMGAIK